MVWEMINKIMTLIGPFPSPAPVFIENQATATRLPPAGVVLLWFAARLRSRPPDQADLQRVASHVRSIDADDGETGGVSLDLDQELRHSFGHLVRIIRDAGVTDLARRQASPVLNMRGVRGRG